MPAALGHRVEWVRIDPETGSGRTGMTALHDVSDEEHAVHLRAGIEAGGR